MRIATWWELDGGEMCLSECVDEQSRDREREREEAKEGHGNKLREC